MRSHVARSNGPRLSHATRTALLTWSVVCFLAGAALLVFTGVDPITAFSLIALGGVSVATVVRDGSARKVLPLGAPTSRRRSNRCPRARQRLSRSLTPTL